MLLSELLDRRLDRDVEIDGLAYDSRSITKGSLFFCLTGESHDGHDYAADAVRRGAAALVVERPTGLGVPEVPVDSARAAMPPAACRFFGDPSRELDVIGITGTNGKTTSAHLLRAALEANGRRCGMLGTVSTIVGGMEAPSALTTPEAIDLQRALRRMADAGDRACVMEVSSHALAVGRCAGIEFRARLFTNLTRDHLDFHATMDGYFEAKRRLFAGDPGARVVNVDDGFGRALLREYPESVSFAIDLAADYRARDLELVLEGSRFTVASAGRVDEVRVPLPGRYNVSNALGVFAAARTLGLDVAPTRAALASAPSVPGRFEVIDEGQDFVVIVDFAHTPDALEQLLRTARGLADGRVICVFGRPGGRDRGIRPLLGEVAGALADRAIVTSDDFGDDDPAQIIEDIVRGAPAEIEVVFDRRQAIAHAADVARQGDIVIIAGRGHLRHQELGNGRRRPLQDADVARQTLRSREPSTI